METDTSTSSHSSSVPTSTVTDQSHVYKSISKYPFDSDDEFQSGLSSILGHPGTPATPAEQASKDDLVVKAQCFFYARKFGISTPIDPAAYQAWKAQTGTTSHDGPSGTPISPDRTVPSHAADSNDTAAPAAASASTTAQPPPYPTSFAAIVELITNNKPIPGIEEVPDTVLQLGSSKQDTVNRRRKPWEKEDAEVTPAPAPSARLQDTLETAAQEDPQGDENVVGEDPDEQTERINHIRKTGVGVMHLLSPDAVPDSGLIAKN